MADPGTRYSALRKDPAASPVGIGASRRCTTCGEQFPLDFVVCPKDATELVLAGSGDDPLIGEIISGTFCITSMLGEGGMGRVYVAEHVRLPRRFAIKVMLEELLKYPDALARFEREAQAVARVSSEHVIEVVDLVRLKDGRPCLVTELLEGQELGEMLDAHGRMPIAAALTVARQVCRGLSAAHAVGVVHRDLKPSNLFLVNRADGQPFAKILDFGVAKLSDGANLTRTGMVVGTPAYMSPEQARGDKGVDERADVYSLGAVLYHMITGSPPFGSADEPGVVLTRVLTQDPQRPRELVASIPEAVEALVMRALARDAERRPSSTAELEFELTALEQPASKKGGADSAREPARPAIASAETMLAPVSVVERAAPVSAPPRWSRLGAAIAIGTFAAGVAATVFAAGAAMLRLYEPQAVLRPTEIAMLAAVSAVAAAGVVGEGVKLVLRRWRSAAAADSVGGAFAGSASTLLGCSGVLAVAWADINVVTSTPLNPRFLPLLDVVVATLPLVLSALVFAVMRRGARRVS
jgi:serine/threonine-protein kinase